MSQLVTQRDQMNSVRDLLEKMKGQLSIALPRHMTADRMVRVALTSIQRTPELLDCDRKSLAGAIIQCSQLGLEPDGVLGWSYLVPFKKQVQLLIGYKGLIQLARRSGEISTIEAVVVREGDVFQYERGLHPILRHVPGNKEDAAITHAYAIVRLKDGGYQFDVMSVKEMEAIRRKSPAGNSPAWTAHTSEMYKKTVLRRVMKLSPCSVEAQTAIALDERAEAGIPQDLEVLHVTTEPEHDVERPLLVAE